MGLESGEFDPKLLRRDPMLEGTETVDKNDRDVPPEARFKDRVGGDVHDQQLKLFNRLDLRDNFQYVIAESAPFAGIQDNRRL